MEVQEITIVYGGTIPTVQYGNRTLQISTRVVVEPGETLAAATARTMQSLRNLYNNEEATIKAIYNPGVQGGQR